MSGELTTAVLQGITNIGCALLFIGISIPLLKGQVKMNKTYGIRVKKAFESEDMWYRLNAYGARQLIIWSLPLIPIGVAAFFVPVDGKENLPWLLTSCLAPGVICVPPII